MRLAGLVPILVSILACARPALAEPIDGGELRSRAIAQARHFASTLDSSRERTDSSPPPLVSLFDRLADEGVLEELLLRFEDFLHRAEASEGSSSEDLVAGPPEEFGSRTGEEIDEGTLHSLEDALYQHYRKQGWDWARRTPDSPRAYEYSLLWHDPDEGPWYHVEVQLLEMGSDGPAFDCLRVNVESATVEPEACG